MLTYSGMLGEEEAKEKDVALISSSEHSCLIFAHWSDEKYT